jgi:hypothetical protein
MNSLDFEFRRNESPDRSAEGYPPGTESLT